MSVVDDLEIQMSHEDPLQLSNTPVKPKVKPALPTVHDVLLLLLDPSESEECLKWANHRYALNATRTSEENAKEAQHILERWKTVKAQRLKWSVLPTLIPSLSKDTITVADLHAYLSEILAIHPLVATIPVYHEECCGARETGEIEFDEEKGILNFY
jgi:hypothetical protein